MVIRKFLLILKSCTGCVYSSDVFYDGLELQGAFASLDAIGVRVLDVIPVEFDLSKYEH